MKGPGIELARMREMEEISVALHAMCQPLTALQCQLELGQMNEDAAHRAALLNGKGALWTERLFEECLRECVRMNTIVITMRTLIQKQLSREQEENG
jgi:hypothetical protein